LLPATPKTSSEAIAVRQPKAQALFRPVTACGSAAGASTSVTTRKRERPMLRPTATIVGLTVRKPMLRLIAIGQIVESAIVKTIALELIPNQSIASGRIATPGRGLKIEVSSSSRVRAGLRERRDDREGDGDPGPDADTLEQELQRRPRRSGKAAVTPAGHERPPRLPRRRPEEVADMAKADV